MEYGPGETMKSWLHLVLASQEYGQEEGMGDTGLEPVTFPV